MTPKTEQEKRVDEIVMSQKIVDLVEKAHEKGAQAEREKIIEDMKNINMLSLMGVDKDKRKMLNRIRDVFVTWLEQGK